MTVAMQVDDVPCRSPLHNLHLQFIRYHPDMGDSEDDESSPELKLTACKFDGLLPDEALRIPEADVDAPPVTRIPTSIDADELKFGPSYTPSLCTEDECMSWRGTWQSRDVLIHRIPLELASVLAQGVPEHPYVVSLLAIAEHHSYACHAYAVSELPDGGFLCDQGALTLNDALVAAISVARAIHAMHRTGIVHGALDATSICLHRSRTSVCNYATRRGTRASDVHQFGLWLWHTFERTQSLEPTDTTRTVGIVDTSSVDPAIENLVTRCIHVNRTDCPEDKEHAELPTFGQLVSQLIEISQELLA